MLRVAISVLIFVFRAAGSVGTAINSCIQANLTYEVQEFTADVGWDRVGESHTKGIQLPIF